MPKYRYTEEGETSAAAATCSIVGLTTVDTSGEVGLAATGWLLLVPCLPGLVAVVKLWVWRGRR